MAKTLFILNDPPYGIERSYNALRPAGSLSKRDGEDVKVFLIGQLALASRQGVGREVVALHQAVNGHWRV